MGLHERAWTGLNLLVFGDRPIVPMQIEQAIATAAPSQEVIIDSFENYGDALDFCKSRRNIGFVFLLEGTGAASSESTFRELAKAYESKGWPCFGVLLHSGTETLSGHRALRDSPNLIHYRSFQDFTDPARTATTLAETWDKFTQAFEQSLIPVPLQETLLSLAQDELKQDSIHFLDRLCVLLSSNLNISWLETVSLRWEPILSAAASRHPAAVAPHGILRQICELAALDDNSSSIEELTMKKLSLSKRILGAARRLDSSRTADTLEHDLRKIAAHSRPGAPALLRHIASYRERILEIASSVASSHSSHHSSGAVG